MRRGSRELERGMRELARHRPDRALKLLREAVDSCPASRPAQLSARLYWLSVALLRLDRPELALKSLASAQKLRTRGYARAAYAARSNEYGMPRRAKPELDDFYAFYSLQAGRYLGTRPGGRFAAAAEKDAVTRLIAEAWTGLRASGRLAGLGPGGKLALSGVLEAQAAEVIAAYAPYIALRVGATHEGWVRLEGEHPAPAVP